MCPVCLATAVIIAGSAGGTGGLAALVAATFRTKKSGTFPNTTTIKEDHDGHEYDRGSSSQDRLAR